MEVRGRLANDEPGLGEVGEPHGATAREAVGRRDDGRDRLVEQRASREIREDDELAHDRELHLIGADEVGDEPRMAAPHERLDPGMPRGEAREGPRRQIEGEVRREADREEALASLGPGLRLGRAAAQGVHRGDGAGQEAPPRRRERHAAPSPHQQLRPELALEAVQAGRAGRLGQSEGVRGTGDRPAPVRLDEGLDLAQLHR